MFKLIYPLGYILSLSANAPHAVVAHRAGLCILCTCTYYVRIHKHMYIALHNTCAIHITYAHTYYTRASHVRRLVGSVMFHDSLGTGCYMFKKVHRRICSLLQGMLTLIHSLQRACVYVVRVFKLSPVFSFCLSCITSQ